MTKKQKQKRSLEIFGVKMGIFSLKKVIKKVWSAKIFPVPQTRCQVSGYDEDKTADNIMPVFDQNTWQS